MTAYADNLEYAKDIAEQTLYGPLPYEETWRENAAHVLSLLDDLADARAENERLSRIADLADELRLWDPRGHGDERHGYEKTAGALFEALKAREKASPS